MFESFPDSGKSFDPALNLSLTSLAGNLEPMDCITPECAVKKLTTGSSSSELLDTTLRSPGSDDSSILLPKSFLSQSVDAPATNPSPVDPLTGMGAQVPEIVEQAVQLTYDALTEFAISSDFSNKMNLAFGDSFDTKVADAIAHQFAQGDFSDLPEIEILSDATINGANAAFSEETNKIYLSSEFVAKNTGNVDAIANVLLEEIGHDIDSKINVKDAAGDEGDIFSRLVQGKQISASEFVALKAEDDTATITLDGKTIQIEQAANKKADFNGDGKTDFIRQEKGVWDDDNINTANVYLSNSDGTFRKQDLPWGDLKSDDGVNLILGDFNGDKKTDFIRQEKNGWDDDDINTANILLSNGDGTFSRQDLTNWSEMKGDLTNLIVGDYNGDGKDDFIRQEKGVWDDDDINTANVYLSNGNGTFSKQDLTNWSQMKGDLTNLIVGDYNGDGKDDFIRQEKGVWDDDEINTANVYLSNGNGTFSKQDLTNWSEMKGDLTNLIVGDFNGDRKTDFIRQEKGVWDDDNINTANLYLSNGNGTFSKRDILDADSLKGDLTNLIVGDFTGGGADDFIRQEKSSWDDDNYRTAEIYTSNSGIFSKISFTNEPDAMKGDFTNLILGDFNGDRKTDFIRQEKGVWDDDNYRSAEVYMNLGNFTFSKRDLTNDPNSMKGDDGVNIIASSLQTFSPGVNIPNNPSNPGSGNYYKDLSSWSDNMWDQQTGDNVKFDDRGNDESDSRVKQIYADLSTAIFGRKNEFNAGYVFDSSYRNGIVIEGRTGWSHSGIDIAASQNEVVQAVVSGKIGKIYNEGAIGYAIGVDETDASGREVGRRWWYLHLAGNGNWREGDTVTAGLSNFGRVLASQGHIHLTVQNANFEQRGHYNSLNQNVVLGRTMSPLQAYWQYRNK